MSYRYLAGAVEASWQDGSLVGAPSALLNMLPTGRTFSLPVSGTSSNPFPCGTTSEFLMPDLGEVVATSSPVGSPAKTCQPLKRNQKESRENSRGSGKKCSGSSPKPSHPSCSLKILPCSAHGGSSKSSKGLPAQGTMRSGVVLEVPMPQFMPRISEPACGYWPTVRASDAHGGPITGRKIIGLSTVDKKGVRWGASLKTMVAYRGKNSGRLNPEWVEWLMMWPIGWTGLKPLEMDRFLSWLQLHSSY